MHSSKIATASSRLSSSQIENPKIVQSFRICGTRFQSPLQIFVRARSVVGLREDHPQTVVGLRIAGTDHNGVLENFAGLLPIFLLAISVAEIFECDQMIGI